MAKRHLASREAGSEIPVSRWSSRPAAPPSTMPSPCLNHPAQCRIPTAPGTGTTAFTTPCFTSESRSAMTAAAPSPTRNRSTARRRPSRSSARSPTASRYGRIFGARSPPGPTDAAAAPAFPTIPTRQFAQLAGCSSRHATQWQSATSHRARLAQKFPPAARHHGLPRHRRRCLPRASTIQRRIALPQPPAHAQRPSPHPVSRSSHAVQ